MNKTVGGIIVGVIATVAGGLLLQWVQTQSTPDVIPKTFQGAWNCRGEKITIGKDTVNTGPNQNWKVVKAVTVGNSATDDKQALKLTLESGVDVTFGVVDGVVTLNPAQGVIIPPNMDTLGRVFAEERRRNAIRCERV